MMRSACARGGRDRVIFIVGGPCRTGKTTLGSMLHRALGVSPVPTDALVWMLQLGAPQLGVRHGARFDKAERLFPFLAAFVDAYTAGDKTLILEGDAVAPEHASGLAGRHQVQACFLGHRQALPNDLTMDLGWASGHSREQLQRLAQFVALSSERTAKDCRRMGWPYFDVGERGRAAALTEALETLLQGLTSQYGGQPGSR